MSVCGVANPRAPREVVLSREQGEGRGARVRRSIGGARLRNFDPFLMLDEFKVGVPAGFPDHPHRGMITVTYVLPTSVGVMDHEDSIGNAGRLAAGDLQFMLAGRGILHAEVPGDDGAECHGLQLWVNLPAKHKMDAPEYQELRANELKTASSDGVDAVIIAGEAFGVSSQIRTGPSPVHYVHFKMSPGSVLKHAIPVGWNAFAYTLSGSADFGSGDGVGAHHTVTFSNDASEDGVVVRASPHEEGAEFVLISGQPHGEPIVQHGPFVMNTNEEIMQAFSDFQGGKNGFESVRGWRSEIQYRTR